MRLLPYASLIRSLTKVQVYTRLDIAHIDEHQTTLDYCEASYDIFKKRERL